MIYCGSGSFGNVLVPVPAPVPVPEPDLFSTVFNNKIFVQNLAFSMLEAALFPRKYRLYFFFFFFLIYLESGSKSGFGTRTGTHYGSGSVKAIIAFPAAPAPGSGSTALIGTTRRNILPIAIQSIIKISKLSTHNE
jgi:hypothetical protein